MRPHPEEPAAVLAAWLDDRKRVQRGISMAARRRLAAEALVADAPAVRAARAGVERAAWARMAVLVTHSLVAWSGPDLPEWSRAERPLPAALLALLPMLDVRALAQAADAMRTPGVVEGKA